MRQDRPPNPVSCNRLQGFDDKSYNNTLAQKIIFTEDTTKGVTVSSTVTPDHAATDYVLGARKELIISASTFQSP